MRNIKSAIVTGATGAIGISLCKLLSDKGIKVYAVCHTNSNRITRIPSGVAVIKCDMNNYRNLTKLFNEKMDAVFHLAWSSPSGEGRHNPEVQLKNVEYTLDLLKASVNLGAKVFVGAGSQAEYGRHNEPLTPLTPCEPYMQYGAAKLAAGNMCKIAASDTKTDFIWTRILSVYGPCDGEKSMISKLIHSLENGEKPKLSKCEQMWDYLYCDDAARALYMLAQKGVAGKTYVVASGESKALKEYVEKVKDCINPDAQIGYGEFAVKNPLELRADISALTADTGFVPKIDFDEGIRRTVEWYRNTENNAE